MKRGLGLILLVFMLVGCRQDNNCLERGLALREKLLQSDGYSFEAEITADYTDKLYTFSMKCEVTEDGNLRFTVTEPETISDISGVISGAGGQLTFQDTALTFPLLADGEVSPVSAPWILIRTLQSGYLTACGIEDDRLRLTIDDSYEQDALQVDVWLDSEDMPERAEVLWQGRRVLSLNVEEFNIV